MNIVCLLPEGSLPGSLKDDPVEVPLTGLVTRTEYHYRFVATDECELEPVAHPGVTSTCATKGENETFKTLPPALVEAVFATDVRSTSATVHARIQPVGVGDGIPFRVWPLSSACAGGNAVCRCPMNRSGRGGPGCKSNGTCRV